MKILITGPQGSGKTTQAKLLAEFLEVPLIDSGEILRRLAGTETEDGRRVKEALDSGLMAPDEVVGKMVSERVGEPNCRNGFVMDGYPRTLAQKQVFDPKFDRVFYLEINDEEVRARLKERGRADDTPELIEKRLSLYHQLTEPVLGYYQDLGILTRIDGSKEIDLVQAAIRSELDG